MKLEPILLDESKRLIRLEEIIQQGKQTFIDVGFALAEIRDRRLYRADFPTFEQYCRDKWGWERRYAYNLMESAGAVQSLPEDVRHGAQITNERQARELAKVEPEKRAEVIEKAAKSGKITAKSIKEAAAEEDIPFDAPAPNLSPLAQQVHDELDVAIEDAREIVDELEAGTVDKDALTQTANEFSRLVKLIHKLMKEAK